MMKSNAPMPSGPINGANLTAETRNYPWHRNAEVTEFNGAVSRVIADLDNDREGELVHSLLEIEMPVGDIASNILLRQVAKGVLPIDLAILIAGPVARYIEIIAKDNGMPAKMDMTDESHQTINGTMLRAELGMPTKEKQDVEDQLQEFVQPDVSGFMSMPSEGVAASPDEQQMMLGDLPTLEQEDTL